MRAAGATAAVAPGAAPGRALALSTRRAGPPQQAALKAAAQGAKGRRKTGSTHP